MQLIFSCTRHDKTNIMYERDLLWFESNLEAKVDTNNGKGMFQANKMYLTITLMSGPSLSCLGLFRVHDCLFRRNVCCLYWDHHQIDRLSFANTKISINKVKMFKRFDKRRLACRSLQSVDSLYQYFAVHLRSLIALKNMMKELQTLGQLPIMRACRPSP